jgi:hypothetical protein
MLAQPLHRVPRALLGILRGEKHLEEMELLLDQRGRAVHGSMWRHLTTLAAC